MNPKTEYQLSDPRALDLIWVYLELFPEWDEAQRLENIRGILRQTDRGADYLIETFEETKGKAA